MKQLLPDILLEAEEEPGTGACTLYECRHCGAKFDEDRSRCDVCGAFEIATYAFASSDEDDGR